MKIVKIVFAAALVTALSACHEESGNASIASALTEATPNQPTSALAQAFNAGTNASPSPVNANTASQLTAAFGNANGEPIRFAPGTTVQSIFASATR